MCSVQKISPNTCAYIPLQGRSVPGFNTIVLRCKKTLTTSAAAQKNWKCLCSPGEAKHSWATLYRCGRRSPRTYKEASSRSVATSSRRRNLSSPLNKRWNFSRRSEEQSRSMIQLLYPGGGERRQGGVGGRRTAGPSPRPPCHLCSRD